MDIYFFCAKTYNLVKPFYICLKLKIRNSVFFKLKKFNKNEIDVSSLAIKYSKTMNSNQISQFRICSSHPV